MKLRWIGLGIAIFLAAGSPAYAHDQLVDSSPRPGESVEAAEISLNLTFAEDLLNIGSGAQIVVTGPTGELANNGCAQISGTQAITQLDLINSGTYTVGWRVVSGDGHPISGTYTFEVTNTSNYTGNPNFQMMQCDNPIETLEDLTAQDQPQVIYWLLFASLGLVAGGLFFFLRPKNKSGSNGPKGQD